MVSFRDIETSVYALGCMARFWPFPGYPYLYYYYALHSYIILFSFFLYFLQTGLSVCFYYIITWAAFRIDSEWVPAPNNESQ